MPKIIKGIAGKTPPKPSANAAEIQNWVEGLMPRVQPIAKVLDELIRSTIPSLQYAIRRNRALYGLPKLGWLIEIAPYSISANTLFYGGADFDNPPPLGNTDRTRYIKLTTEDEAKQPELRSWIKQASRTPGWQ